ncbi:hypothetical protein TNCV_1445451 [Trichonephila clavipes]|nr:hypothetical protein TNCV_1445451 [Trichonephila clavipes]
MTENRVANMESLRSTIQTAKLYSITNIGSFLPIRLSKESRQCLFVDDINKIDHEFSEIDKDEFSENESILVGNDNDLSGY